MNKHRVLGFAGMMLFTALAAMTGVKSAEAATLKDFNITVPVLIKTAHKDVAKLKVFCVVKTAQGGTVIGSGGKEFSTNRAGNYRREVLVSFNATAGKTASAAHHAFCHIMLKKKGGNRWSVIVWTSDSAASNDWRKPKQGSVRVVEAKKTF